MNSARVGLLHSSAINHIWNWTHQWTWWPLGRSRRGFDSSDRRSGSACSVCCRSPQTHLASLVSHSGCTENQKPLYEPSGVGCLFAESEISRVDENDILIQRCKSVTLLVNESARVSHSKYLPSGTHWLHRTALVRAVTPESDGLSSKKRTMTFDLSGN